ncbi:hypothetical protein LVX13_19620 [Streptomyces albulus]|uniref:hypothetical protein n=1 Tax=Streptomyces noursei TaxID=1971 RepID=UPI001F1C96CC|nr:hypothetical protein [Streptomyces noursei]MCE4945305.1 hypothetical protein [Streptomyces noursei]
MYAAVVDGAGHHAAVVAHAAIAPAVITHTGMVMGGLAGLTTARQMAHAYDVPPHASAVYACMEPGWPTSVHWIGHCRAYGWDGAALTQWTTDQTMGPWLRWNGGKTIELVPAEVAETQGTWARLGLAQAGVATCCQVEIREEIRLVLLVSDGSRIRWTRRRRRNCAARTRMIRRHWRMHWSLLPTRTRTATTTTQPSTRSYRRTR